MVKSVRLCGDKIGIMELLLKLRIQQLPEGVCLATSDDLPGLVAQGRTVNETLEIARDVARRLLEARRERQQTVSLPEVTDMTECTIVVAA